jgi:hypothetical protein
MSQNVEIVRRLIEGGGSLPFARHAAAGARCPLPAARCTQEGKRASSPTLQEKRMVVLCLDESQDRLGADAVVLHCFCRLFGL